MNRDDIIRMARDFGWVIYEGMTYMDVQAIQDALIERLERFFHAAYAAGAAAEREAILQMSRDQWFKTQADFEDAIRARGQG